MQCDFKENDSVVSMIGELTFNDHAAFLTMMNRLLATSGQPLVIELSQLEFIDSAGLGMLLIARDEATKANRKLTLRAPRGQIKRMFTVTRFDSLFTVSA